MEPEEKSQLKDIDNIKIFLDKIGFKCLSHKSSDQLIYTKKGDVIIIKNNKN